jgi:hypothetical protein
MSRPARLGAICFEPEAAWGEDVTTFGTRLPTIGMVDVSKLVQAKVNPDRTVQLRNEITAGVNGIMGGEFTTKFMLTGHGSTTNTTIALNSLETLLGKAVGNAAAAFTAANTTATGAGSTTAPGVSAASGGVAGSLVRIGAKNDGRGGGQFYWMNSHSASVINLNNALPNTLSNGDIIYNPAIVFTSESPTGTDIVGQRFLLQTANQEYECHGVYPKSISWDGLSTGEDPSCTITWGVSWWRESTATFPSALAVQTFPHAPVAGGSFVLQTSGVTTRATRDIRSFKITHSLGIVELRGPAGVNTNQAVIGCKRTQDVISCEWTEDHESNTATPDLAGKWAANTQFYLLYSLSAADGTSLGILSAFVVPDGNKPTQIADGNINRVRFMARLGADNSKSTDRERAAFRLAIA